MTIALDPRVATSTRRHLLDRERSCDDPWAVIPERLRGRLRDCDSHLILNPEETYRILGPDLGEPMLHKRTKQYAALDGLMPFTKDGRSVWKAKGTMAYGARDARERLDVLDEMGVHQQILFGSGMASVFWGPAELAYPAARRFNQFAAEWAALAPDRLRPAAIVNCQDPTRALEEAEYALSLGFKAAQLAFYPDFRPGPDHEAWEGLWALLSHAGVPALLHWDMRWSLIERAGEASKVHVRTGISVHEGRNGPSSHMLGSILPESASSNEAFAVMTAHHTPEHFLSTLALSGVFERHPRLRLGVFECTSFWIGPWLERLDALESALRGAVKNSERLSSVVRRALRVTPLYGEPFIQHMNLHKLQDVFVFASDFPHPEGGIQPLQEIAQQSGGKEDVLEKVLVSNADAVFPA